MVYVGPSTGCYLCRKRKIKCSEERPGCRNCSVYGSPCPGYRSDVPSRNEQSQKSRRRATSTKKRNEPSEKPPFTSSEGNSSQSTQSASDGADELASLTESSGSGSGSTSIATCGSSATDLTDDSQHLALSLYRASDSTWDERAVCFFFDQYTTVGESGDCISHLQCLPGLYARCQERSSRDAPSSCLRWAVNATALMSLGQESQASALTHKARKNYGMAIRELRQQLTSPDQATKDEIFAAVVMLALFEDISGERNGLSSSHTAGMELLLKLRGQSQLSHPQGRSLFAYAYAQTHIEILALGDRPRFSNDWIIKALCGTDPVQRMIVISSKISQLFLQVSSMQPQVKATDASPDWVQSQVTSWIDAAQVLERELVEWPRQLPEHWLPLHVYGQNGEPALLTYQRLSYTSIWNYYRAVRIVMQRMLTDLRATVGILALAGGIPGSSTSNNAVNINNYLLDDYSSSSAHDIIQQMISHICRSLPFALGDIDAHGKQTFSFSFCSRSSASSSSSSSSWSHTSSEKPKIKAIHGYSLLWPLWYVLSCGMATPSQASQVRAALARLGSASGIKLALVLANGLPEMEAGMKMGMGMGMGMAAAPSGSLNPHATI